MHRRKFIQASTFAGASWCLAPQINSLTERSAEPIPVGIIGLDTSHSIAFTKIFNNPDASHGFRVTHAYPHGSRDIESSVSRIPRYTKEISELGVQVVDTLKTLLDEVHLILLETNDGRLHLEQAQAVFEAGKRMFIDKPLAASLEDVIKIFDLSKRFQLPVFSASALRFSPSTVAVAGQGKIGRVLGADTYSPAVLEPTHPDLFWYGIHGVEALFTVMGRGCVQVSRRYQQGADIVVGEWKDGRLGTFRGIREGKTGYGGTAFGTEGIAAIGQYEGYEPLVSEIIQFFNTGTVPVSPEETIELFAFMEAAEQSKRRSGEPVSIQEVLQNAQ